LLITRPVGPCDARASRSKSASDTRPLRQPSTHVEKLQHFPPFNTPLDNLIVLNVVECQFQHPHCGWSNVTPLLRIDNTKSDWSIKVRVVRIWHVRSIIDHNKINEIQLILIDQEVMM
jgi:hypothetical protein